MLSQVSETLQSIELELNLPSVTVFNMIPRDVTLLMHYVGLTSRKLKVVLKYSNPQYQN